jgi:glycosyltransferase involved in cell wall biosynthesis
VTPGGPRTVLYTAWAPFFSGAERALLILLDHLDRSRYRPVVALGTRGELEAALGERGIATVHVPVVYSGVRTLPRWLSSVGRLVRLARAERAALVHANDVPSFQPAGYAARWIGRPAVTHVRFPDTRAGFEWFLKPGFEHALFVSADLRNGALAAAPDLFGPRSEVVHDGVLLPAMSSDDERRRVRETLGLPLDRPVVALTGQIAEIKGIWEFIDAAEILLSRGVGVSFAVLGDDLKGQGALRRKAERVVSEKGIGGGVTFLGFRPDAPGLIPAFDVVAVPSHVEPLGNATLEAMAAGIPVVGSEVGGIPEMVVDGETGLLVPGRNAAALAAAIETLVADPERRAAFGRAARARAQAAFSPEAHAARVQAIYDRLLARSPS